MSQVKLGTAEGRCPKCGSEDFRIPEDQAKQVTCVRCGAEVGTAAEIDSTFRKAVGNAMPDIGDAVAKALGLSGRRK
jgi:Zn ribbon nucleic-acid-binding protein